MGPENVGLGAPRHKLVDGGGRPGTPDAVNTMAMGQAWVGGAYFALLLTLAGCSCDGAARVRGDHPYLRCAMLDAPPAGDGAVGALSWKVKDRHAAIAGAPSSFDVAVFAGPAPSMSATAFPQRLEVLRAQPPALIFVLGGIGDSESIAKTTLKALASLPSVTFVLGGGRDDVRVWARSLDSDALTGPGKVFDARGLRDVRVGDVTFVLASGSPDGRYAVGDNACGLTPADADTIGSEAKADGSAAYLVSWAAAAGTARGIAGAAVGDPGLAAVAKAISAKGGWFTWPAEAVPEAPFHAVGRVGDLPTPRGGDALATEEPSVFHVSASGITPRAPR